jgi:hypothetical protein
LDWRGTQHDVEGKKGEMHTGFWWGNLKGRGHFEDLDFDGKII